MWLGARAARAVAPPLIAALMLASVGCAHDEAGRAAPRLDRDVLALNREAAAAYERGDREAAREKLVRALAVAREAQIDDGPAAAKTRANLGALYVLAYARRSAGIKQLAGALRIDANARPSPAFLAPSVERALVAARKQARRAAPPPPDDDAEPVDVVDAQADDDETSVDGHRRGAGSFWVGLGGGMGSGWHPLRALEGASDLKTTSGYSNTGLVVSPEVGWQITRGFAIAIAGRHQFLPANGWQQGQGAEPPRMANAAFLRLVWSIGAGNAVWLLSAAAGGGDGFRLMVPRRPGAGLPHDDTVRGGPFAFGPGGGFAYHFHRAFAWHAEARVLIGAPDLAGVLEVNTGPQIGF